MRDFFPLWKVTPEQKPTYYNVLQNMVLFEVNVVPTPH